MPSSGDLEVLEHCGDAIRGRKTLKTWLSLSNSRLIVDAHETKARIDSYDENDEFLAYWTACRLPQLPIVVSTEGDRHAFDSAHFGRNIVTATTEVARQTLQVASRQIATVRGTDAIELIVDARQKVCQLRMQFNPAIRTTSLLCNERSESTSFDLDDAQSVISFWLIYGWIPIGFMN